MNNERLKEIISILKNNKIITDRSPVNVRRTIEDLGPTFIKIGQILSTRVDLLSEEYITELSKLRSNVEPLDFNIMEDVLYKEYGNYKDYFIDIDKTSIGSASIAQVYKATLSNGREVVLKIKKPGIDEEMKEDFELLKEASKILHLNSIVKVMDMDSLIEELYKSTLRELDFRLEERNIIEFKNNNREERHIDAPNIVHELCNDNVIVMEYIRGTSINDITELKNKNYNLNLIANALSANYIKQALEDGLFHADPHPNNILMTDDSIIFLDWGMVGRLSNHNKALLKKCAEAIVMENYSLVSEVLISMSKSHGDVNKINLTDGITRILNKYATADLDSIRIDEFVNEMFKLLRNNNLTLDHDITMLARGICIIESVLKDLNPEINLIEVFENKLHYKNGIDLKKETKKIGKQIYKTANSMSNIPVETEKLLAKVNDKDYKLKFELSDSDNHIDKLENIVHEMILGFLDGCLIVGYSNINDLASKNIFLIGIIIVTILLVIKMFHDLIHKGY